MLKSVRLIFACLSVWFVCLACHFVFVQAWMFVCIVCIVNVYYFQCTSVVLKTCPVQPGAWIVTSFGREANFFCWRNYPTQFSELAYAGKLFSAPNWESSDFSSEWDFSLGLVLPEFNILSQKGAWHKRRNWDLTDEWPIHCSHPVLTSKWMPEQGRFYKNFSEAFKWK